MPIFKTEISVTVFCERDTMEEAQNLFANMELQSVLEEMTDGEFIGAERVGATVEVPAEKLADELVAIGNDGTFFDGLDDTEEDDD